MLQCLLLDCCVVDCQSIDMYGGLVDVDWNVLILFVVGVYVWIECYVVVDYGYVGQCIWVVVDQYGVFDWCVNFVFFDFVSFGVGEYEFVGGDVYLIVVEGDCVNVVIDRFQDFLLVFVVIYYYGVGYVWYWNVSVGLLVIIVGWFYVYQLGVLVVLYVVGQNFVFDQYCMVGWSVFVVDV